jgi:hypothetical protein
MKKEFKKTPREESRSMIKPSYLRTSNSSRALAAVSYQTADDDDYFFEVEDY